MRLYVVEDDVYRGSNQMRLRRAFRSAVTGRWVKAIFARRHKRITVEEHYQ